MMATEVQSGDLDSATSSRLEVSIDGLTLSPDPEGEQTQLEEPQPEPGEPDTDTSGAAGGEDGETAKSAIERKWGFPLLELYGMGLKFFKDKDGKAFHPTYEEKLRLVALHKQVLLGPYNPDASPEVGFFDVLGNDRRKEWASLGNLEKEEAMVEFVKLLNKCCNLFAPYVTSHKIEREEQERKREEEERQRLEEEERERQRQEEERRRLVEEERQRREEEERREAEEERLRIEQQKQQIMAALNAQTAVQFQQYAAQQYPNSPEQQLGLIRQLQEQHYQQYMQQLYQVQLAQQQAALQKQQMQADSMLQGTLDASGFGGGELIPASAAGLMYAASPPSGDEPPTVNGGHSDSYSESMNREPAPEPAEEVSENGPLLADSPPVIAAPSMWTRPQIKDFKEKIRQDADSVITVGRGEVVTVRVPTHEEGAYLFWEFATDYYDIGFGVFFEWTDAASAAVSVHVSESSDEDEEEEGEPPSEEEKAKKEAGKPQVDEIVPVYRRDCHEEVYAGSHQYPGRGVYLLKFDNSYSLWRSKSVYYRVYYTR
ncbi:Golgi resident protein GCP60 isoform X3 [Gasterosteus aculeatus]|uniref:Golgi resident protein GCP60 isoform X3 n=1 Tax=Gasterosteus aculeatus aculeatus TaxID=481459 RepID=UPI001A97E3FE|nr:Golgi resident protein GCP60 isoform X3 [Gasterosteus aculeatus aculeatus]